MVDIRPYKVLLLKLKRLNEDIKIWRCDRWSNENDEYSDILKIIETLEIKVESCILSSLERLIRKNWKNRLIEIDTMKRLDLRQKARLKWCIDGDENIKFFHGVLNGKRKK